MQLWPSKLLSRICWTSCGMEWVDAIYTEPSAKITHTGLGFHVFLPKARSILAVSFAVSGSLSACAPSEKIWTCQEIPVW